VEAVSVQIRRGLSTLVSKVQKEEPMSDIKSTTVADRNRINIHDNQELRYWSHRLSVSRGELKRAVNKFGEMADDVARALGKSWLHSEAPPDDVA
jgi:uncharacterized protein DUF3606